ncbi:GNAT family N-acetyltransferase [Pelagibius marinus]|uniref:GNAT family N-acetyltransferase n=1 Tax=Pelagibius marinus TaxID=2762760 RepID=UPI0018723116|nr:GNAT family N-acetyltransferase [Pelagibius marinus]
MPTETNFIVAEAEVENAPIVGKLVHNLLKELADGQGPSLNDLTATAKELMASGVVTGLIAFKDQEPVGVLCLNECAAIYARGRFGEITELYVTPEYRSQGIALRLIEAAKKVGEARGWSRLEVGAPDQPAWERTLSFYLKEGFAEIGPRLKMAL